MPARATARRTWPREPAGDAAALQALAAELAAAAEADPAAVFARFSAAARQLLADLDRQGSAPHLASLRDDIARLVAAAVQLRRRMQVIAGSAAAVLPDDLLAEIGPAGLGACIARMEAAADRTLRELQAARPGTGPGNVALRLFGEPRQRLCVACAAVIADLLGADACSGSPTGLLYRAAAAVWDFATAEDAEAFGLARYVRQAAASSPRPATFGAFRPQSAEAALPARS